MDGQDCITGPNHVAGNVKPHMERFWSALIKRWQRESAKAFLEGRPILTGITRNSEPSCVLDWPYLKRPFTNLHRSQCDYHSWVSGSDGATPMFCRGLLPQGVVGVPVTDESGATVIAPHDITCPLPQIMTAVHGWAKAECDALFKLVPLFDAQNQVTLSTSYNALVEIRQGTDVERKGGAGARDREGGFDTTHAGDLPGNVMALNGAGGEDRDWWVDWTGLAAERLRAGFLSSTAPTLVNHNIIATALANLVCNRSAIIEFGRNNTLHLIDQAAERLGESTTSTVETVAHWKILGGLGKVLALAGLGAASAALDLVSFLGEELLPATTTVVEFPHDFRAVVTKLAQELTGLGEQLEGKEAEYIAEVSALRSAINEVGSFDLELYEFGSGPVSGARPESAKGYRANATDIVNLATLCAYAGRGYEQLVGRFVTVLKAEGHLSDRNGVPLAADAEVIAMCAELRDYMTTAGARYFDARDQIAEAALAYEEADGHVAASFERTWAEWEGNEERTYEPSFKADAAEATERPEGADEDPYDEGGVEVYGRSPSADGEAAQQPA